MQCPGSNRFNTPTTAQPRQVRVQVSWFLPNTELMVSCILPKEYQPEVMSNLFSISRHTEFPIWSIPIATLRKIPQRYQSPFLLAEFPRGKKNLNQISPIVRRSPSGSNTTARVKATSSRMRLCRRLLIFRFASI